MKMKNVNKKEEKRVKIVFLGLIVTMIYINCSLAQNIVVDGDFESGVPDSSGTWVVPWKTYGWYPMLFTVSTASARSGSYGAHINWSAGRCGQPDGQTYHGGNSGTYLTQGDDSRDSNPANCQPDDVSDQSMNVLHLTNGVTYELSAWLRINRQDNLTTVAPDGSSDLWGGLRLEIGHKSGQNLLILGPYGINGSGLTIIPQGQWVQIKGDLTEIADTSVVQLKWSVFAHNRRYDADLDDVILMQKSASPVIVVNYPNGGEILGSGIQKTVTWTTMGTGSVGNLNIDLSTDGGANWINLVSNTTNDGNEIVNLPSVKSSNCKIRVSEPDGTPSDISDSVFTIGGTADNYAVSFDGIDDNLTISTGTPVLGSEFTVECFFKWFGNNSHTYTYQVIAGRRSLNSLLEWDLYINETGYLGAGVSPDGTFNNTVWLGDNSNCTIPTNQWHHIALVKTGSNLYLYLNGNRVATRTLTQVGGLPNIPIRLGDLDDSNETMNGVIDELRISKIARYTGTTYNIPTAEFVVDTNTVGLWHFNEGTGTKTYDATSAGNNGTLNNGTTWTDGYPFGGGGTTPSITVTVPNGGETWQTGTTQTVLWSSQGSVGNVNIDLSTDGGTNWTNLVSNTPNDGSQTVTVPNTPSTTCRVRVREPDGTPSDTSDNNFTISTTPPPPGITVIYPNGGETWTVGETRTVQWTSQGSVGNVNIDLSTNSGSTWTTLVSNTANDGSQTITVPNTPSSTCRIRVQEPDGSPSDISNSNFAIQSSGQTEPKISVSTTVLDFGTLDAGQTATLTFDITNTGSGTLTGSITTDQDWITVDPPSFNIPGQSVSQTINVTVDNSVLKQTQGQYTGTITIVSNGGTATVNVVLTATCVLVRPNPYNPNKGLLTFFGSGIVPGETTIKIYTLSGELVKDLSAKTDELIWDGKTDNGTPVANGIYLYTYESPKEKGIGKFTVIYK